MIRVVVGVFLALLLLGGGAVGFTLVRTPTTGEAVEITVPPGASTAEIGELLAEEDIIRSTFVFRVWSRFRGLDGALRAGDYELRRGMGTRAALGVLAAGPEHRAESVTVPEGFMLRQIAERVGDRTHIDGDEFLAVAEGGVVRPEILPDGVDTLEGLLFPETYRVGERDTAEDLVRRMVDEFERRTSDLDWSPATERGLSPYEVIIAASLVEREARVPEDRAKIAAVIYNRLEVGMRLQIDITAIYDLDEHTVPTRRLLERESPYNTYLIDGLPPTPIASPGMASIEAMLDPEPIDALFYVVIDPSGKHGFTADYNEFLRLRERRPEEVRGG